MRTRHRLKVRDPSATLEALEIANDRVGYRNVFSHVPNAKAKEVARMLKAIHAQESLASARSKAADIVDQLKQMRMGKAAGLVEEAIEETLTYYRFPANHWIRVRTNNPMERM